MYSSQSFVILTIVARPDVRTSIVRQAGSESTVFSLRGTASMTEFGFHWHHWYRTKDSANEKIEIWTYVALHLQYWLVASIACPFPSEKTLLVSHVLSNVLDFLTWESISCTKDKTEKSTFSP